MARTVAPFSLGLLFRRMIGYRGQGVDDRTARAALTTAAVVPS